MTPSARVVFFGNEQLATGTISSLPVITTLQRLGCEIVAIVVNTHPTRSRQTQISPIENFAYRYNIPLLQPAKPAEIIDQLISLEADCGVLVAYGRIIPQSIIDIFPAGIVNLHPSLLPHHRGPTPLEQTILDDDRASGVSLMALSANMDEGPVYAQAHVKLDGTESKQKLADMLGQLGAHLFGQHLDSIIDTTLVPIPQDNDQATYTQLLSKTDGILQPAIKPADRLAREIRAYLSFPRSRLELYGHQIIITAAHVTSESSDTSLVVRCADDTYLAIDSLIVPSGKTMSGEAFLRGYHRNKN